MHLITNRCLNTRSKSLGLFGDYPNERGPNELRIVEVTKKGSAYRTKVLADLLTPKVKQDLKGKFKLDIDVKEDHYASLRVACELFERAHTERREPAPTPLP